MGSSGKNAIFNLDFYFSKSCNMPTKKLSFPNEPLVHFEFHFQVHILQCFFGGFCRSS
jgi:hypothetical protein